jgi:hypothetical protein
VDASRVITYVLRESLPRCDLARPYSIGKAFRIAESRVNPNARERSEPNRAKCPREVRGVQNERRRCDTKTKRKHAEEDTRPQELICMLLSSLAGCGPPDLAARREQHEYQEGGAQDHAGDVPNIEVLDYAYEEKTKHKRSNRSAIGIGEELAEGGGVNAHCGAANDILMEGDLFAISLSRSRS